MRGAALPRRDWAGRRLSRAARLCVEHRLFPRTREEASCDRHARERVRRTRGRAGARNQPLEMLGSPQTGPASLVNVPLLEYQPFTPSDCPPKNQEKNASS